MKQTFCILLMIIMTVFGIGWINITYKPKVIAWIVPKGWPKPTYRFAQNKLTEEGVALGKTLFFDPQLSADGTIACADCHQQFAAFTTYEHSLSHGVGNHLTNRNATALQNLAWQSNFMQDGGINHLDVQFLAPLTAPNEMGADLEKVVQYLQKNSRYPLLFKAAFGDTAVTTQRIGKAFSQYLLTLVSYNSKYDKVMRGEAQFILPEQLGYDIFKKKCASCHREPLFTDGSFRNIGMTLDSTLHDVGRMHITLNAADSLKFRVPSLRNVAVTAPYGHDGRFYSLYNVFEHYRNQVVGGPTTDSLLRRGLPLSNYEIGQLTAFLHTLTDSVFLTNPQFGGTSFGTLKMGNHPH